MFHIIQSRYRWGRCPKKKQLGQQTQTELLPLNIDQFTAILENQLEGQQIATKGDVDAIQKELEVMQKELQTITQEGATRDQTICTILHHYIEHRRIYERLC